MSGFSREIISFQSLFLARKEKIAVAVEYIAPSEFAGSKCQSVV